MAYGLVIIVNSEWLINCCPLITHRLLIDLIDVIDFIDGNIKHVILEKSDEVQDTLDNETAMTDEFDQQPCSRT